MKSLVMNKRGISAIVATVLIILITVAAITIIWAAIIPLISQDLGVENIGTSVEIVTSSGYTVYEEDYDGNGNNRATVQLGVSDNENVAQAKIIFEFDGSSQSVIVTAPNANSVKTYLINGLPGAPNSISVAPIFLEGSQNVEGAVTSKATKIKTASLVTSALPTGGDVYDLDGSGSSCVPTEASETACNGGIDEDCNGDVDCDDSACSADPACVPDETTCDDGFDNDGDLLIDCADPNCDGLVGGPLGQFCGDESTPALCTDGFDNDADGDPDILDSTCTITEKALKHNGFVDPTVSLSGLPGFGAGYGFNVSSSTAVTSLCSFTEDDGDVALYRLNVGTLTYDQVAKVSLSGTGWQCASIPAEILLSTQIYLILVDSDDGYITSGIASGQPYGELNFMSGAIVDAYDPNAATIPYSSVTIIGFGDSIVGVPDIGYAVSI